LARDIASYDVRMSDNSHDSRMRRAMIALDGLSVGDAFGECFFAIGTDPYAWQQHLANREPPVGRWRYTDDTEMALAILEVLERHQRIDQDDLAETFARRYACDDRRGYGGMAHRILMELGAGRPWQAVSSAVFNGSGSLGNGGAMRAAPLGAYFADDLPTLIEQAKLSAQVTHWHPEGQAGAIAVAVAAAFASEHASEADIGIPMLRHVVEHTPAGAVREGLERALKFPFTAVPESAAYVLGNGSRVTAPDTVPFALWCAALHPTSYVDAIWTSVSVGGDIDTNCAIVGGIVALSAGRDSIPAGWLTARETLQMRSE
jgi:ADP-ribosylglycohydrolase